MSRRDGGCLRPAVSGNPSRTCADGGMRRRQTLRLEEPADLSGSGEDAIRQGVCIRTSCPCRRLLVNDF